MMIAAIILLLVIATMTAGFLIVVTAHTQVLGDEHRRTMALNLAEAGVEIALAKLQADERYRGEKPLAFAGGDIEIEVTSSGRRFDINSRGRVEGSRRVISRRVRVVCRQPLMGDTLAVETWQEFSR